MGTVVPCRLHEPGIGPKNARSFRRRLALVYLPALAVLSLFVWMLTPPQVSVEGGSSYDHGVAAPGQRIMHNFVLTNRSPIPARIRLASKGCACSSVSVERGVLGPFAQGTVAVAIDVPAAGRHSEAFSISISGPFRSTKKWLFVEFQSQSGGVRAADARVVQL